MYLGGFLKDSYLQKCSEAVDIHGYELLIPWSPRFRGRIGREIQVFHTDSDNRLLILGSCLLSIAIRNL